MSKIRLSQSEILFNFTDLVCLPGKQASSLQKKASASAQPTGSSLLLTTIVSLIGFYQKCIVNGDIEYFLVHLLTA